MNRHSAMKRRLLSQTFNLKLNDRLRKLRPSRVEYGHEGLVISFEVIKPSGGFRLVPEPEFKRWKGKRSIGIWSVGAGAAMVLYAAEIMYPNATIMVKCDPTP